MTERFSGLKYNPKKATQSFEKEFPNLYRHNEFRRLKELPEGDKVAAYILFLYSKETDLVHEHPSNLKERKEAAAIEAGFERDSKGEWPEIVQNLMDIQNKKAYDATMLWLKLQKHVIWTEIVVTEQELFEFQKLRFMAIDTGRRRKKKDEPKDEDEDSDDLFGFGVGKKEVYAAANEKDALMDACNNRIKTLENLYQQFYGDSRKDLQNAEFSEMISPENAERILEEMGAPYEEIRP
jgi:hypothetical protein